MTDSRTGRSEGLKRQKISILGVQVNDISVSSAVSRILKLAFDSKKSHFVVTVNSEFVMLARRNSQFCRILSEADLALPDGAGIVFSKLILGGKTHERITGVDLVEKLCRESAKNAVRVGFLGGFGDVAARVAKRQIRLNPSLKVVFVQPGDPTMGYDLRLKKALDDTGRVDILFVAYGMGQQEFWIARNLNKLNVGVFIGVGGAFDYISRVKRRAPVFFQNIGFEWLWRLINQPQRIWRMRVLPPFLFLILLKSLFRKFNLEK